MRLQIAIRGISCPDGAKIAWTLSPLRRGFQKRRLNRFSDVDNLCYLKGDVDSFFYKVHIIELSKGTHVETYIQNVVVGARLRPSCCISVFRLGKYPGLRGVGELDCSASQGLSLTARRLVP